MAKNENGPNSGQSSGPNIGIRQSNQHTGRHISATSDHMEPLAHRVEEAPFTAQNTGQSGSALTALADHNTGWAARSHPVNQRPSPSRLGS